MHLAINGWFWDEATAGSGQYTRRLVEGLGGLDAGLRISLVVRGEDGPGVGGGRAAAGAWTVHRTGGLRSAGTSQPKVGKVLFEQVAFPRACARLGANVAHVPYWGPPLRSRVPVVVTVHDLIPLMVRGYRGGVLQRLYTALVSASARRAAGVITDSEASQQAIVERLGLGAERVRAVPLAAAEGCRADPSSDDGAVRARYGLPDRYMLYLGGFDVRKNLRTVVATYRWVGPAVGESCPLVVAGRLPERDTSFTPDPRRLMREEGVDRRFVRFSGFVEEEHKSAVYRGAVAFIFPSRYEGFGLPPLEALACGTPVVGSDVASLPEVVGDAGVLLPPGDAEGMARALIRLATDEGFRGEMRGRALDQAGRFSWERTARETLQAYHDALR
ncbi:MAG: glycosyltransferase family 1 protein [Anaerolineae bacterium]